MDAGATIAAIKDALTPLAEKLGQTAIHIYTVFVTQQIVTGVQYLIYAVGCFGGIYALAYVRQMIVNIVVSVYPRNPEYHGAARAFSLVFLCLFAAGLAFSGVEFFADGVKHVANPEYYALQDILNTVKGK